MVVSTEIVNGTDGNLSLKEGNAGVYRDIKMLPPKKKHTITIDPHATYREYAVVSTPGPGGDKVYITSDDCIDNSTITISKDKVTGKHGFKGDRRVVTADSSSSDPQQQQQQASGSVWGLMMRKIWPSKK